MYQKTIDLCCTLLVTTLFFTATSTSAFAEVTMPPQLQNGDVYYMTGGIAEEAEMMRGIAKDYALEVVLVQKSKEIETFLADVNVQILNEQQQVKLEITTAGPYLYVNLPAGRYEIVANFNGEMKKQKATITANKHKKVIFWWPSIEPYQPEDETE